MCAKVGFLCLAAAAAWGIWPPALVGSFPAPPGSTDVGYEYMRLYAMTDGTPPRAFQLNYYNGSVLGSFDLAMPTGGRGITYDFSFTGFWVSNRLNNYIYRLATTGSALSSFYFSYATPYDIGYVSSSFFYHGTGTGLFVACPSNNRVYRITTLGSFVSSFAGPAAAVIAYDEWLAAENNSNYLYWDYYAGNWQVLATLPAPILGIGNGVQWPTRQWVDNYVLCSNNYIYRFSGYTDVAPASLGKVKALFR